MIPESHLDLLTTKKGFAHLATLMKGGTPQVTPVWIDYRDGHVLVNTARGRLKDKNMTRDARVGLAVSDPENPYRYLEVRGRVVEITEVGADDHINAMAKKYMGVDVYPFRQPGEVRVIYRVAPEAVSTMG